MLGLTKASRAHGFHLGMYGFHEVLSPAPSLHTLDRMQLFPGLFCRPGLYCRIKVTTTNALQSVVVIKWQTCMCESAMVRFGGSCEAGGFNLESARAKKKGHDSVVQS